MKMCGLSLHIKNSYYRKVRKDNTKKYYKLNHDDSTATELTEQQQPIIKMIVNSGDDEVLGLPVNERLRLTIDWEDGAVADVNNSYKIASLNKINLDVAVDNPEPEGGVDCFKDCTLVSNYSSIPDDWK